MQCTIQAIRAHRHNTLITLALHVKKGQYFGFVFARAGFNVFGNFGFYCLKIKDFL